MQGYRAVAAHLARWTGSIGGFVRDLDRRGTRYLAFTKVGSLEFCLYQYYLQFVKRVRLRPEPAYFVKGRIFHEAAAKYYRALARTRPLSVEALHAFIDRHDHPEGHHLKNAVQLAVQNAYSGWEVVGVEQAFVLALGGNLPPCVGVIDLVLRQGQHYAVVDHKTGKNFYDPDKLQLAIYHEYVRRRFSPKKCVAVFDEYRWVNNLDRIRKPAFQHTEVKLTAGDWQRALLRLAEGYRRMRRIERAGDAEANGPCYMCPYQARCPKASVSYYGGWS